MIARNQRVRHLASCLPSPSITGGGQGLHGRLMLPIFARATGKRVWRNDMYRLEVWEPDAGEAEHGLRTEFADGIYIVTVHEDTPTDWLDLARRASVAAYEQHPGPNFMPASNYDSAIAVADHLGSSRASRGRVWRTTRSCCCRALRSSFVETMLSVAAFEASGANGAATRLKHDNGM